MSSGTTGGLNGFESKGFETKGFESKGFETKGFGDKDSTDSSKSNCGSFIDFISSIQEISSQESKLETGIDKTLFTIKKSLCGMWSGFMLGVSTMLTVFLYVLIEIAFCFDYVYNYIGNEHLMFAIKSIPIILTVSITLYITSISRYAVGQYTNMAIKTFFTGKLMSTLAIGFVLYFLLSLLEAYLPTVSNKVIYTAGLHFEKKAIEIHTISFILTSISAFAPFFVYAFRKVFFGNDRTAEYDNY